MDDARKISNGEKGWLWRCRMIDKCGSGTTKCIALQRRRQHDFEIIFFFLYIFIYFLFPVFKTIPHGTLFFIIHNIIRYFMRGRPSNCTHKKRVVKNGSSNSERFTGFGNVRGRNGSHHRRNFACIEFTCV